MDCNNIISALPEEKVGFERYFAFSVHKSGSTMLTKMLRDVCERCNFPGVSIPNIFFSKGFKDKQWEADEKLAPVFNKPILYYGFRSLPSVLKFPEVKLRESRFVLLVRDPRDALVSQYFSYGKKSGSHALPKENAEAFIAAREATPERTIDE